MSDKQIALILKDNQIDKTTSQAIEEAFAPLYKDIAKWAEKANSFTITSSDQVDEIKMVKTARQAVGKIMTQVGKTKDDLKENPKRINAAIQAVHNDLIARLEPIKTKLKHEEDFITREEQHVRKHWRRTVGQRLMKPD